MDYKALHDAFPNIVFFPGSSEYIASTGSYWAAFENELRPACIIKPTKAEEVAGVIKFIRPYALTGCVQLAVRSGGHTGWAGSANITGGITLDLQGLNGVTVDPSTKVASIGTGNRWRDVYQALAPQGLATVGGRVAKVGVGGLTTGGGMSYFSAQTGFVCDNVVNYEVVLASGEIVQANKNTNSDLFLALKGGSNNFGIVTRFDFPTFEQGRMWGGAVFYAAQAFPQLVQAFNDFASTSTPDEQAHVIMATSWVAGLEVCVSNLYYGKPVARPPALEPFVAAQPQIFGSLREDSLLGFAEEQTNFSFNGARQNYYSTCTRLDPQLIQDVRELWLKSVDSIKLTLGLTFALVFQPITKGMLEKSAARGGNSLGLSPSDGPLVINLLSTVHLLPVDDEKVAGAAMKLLQDIDDLAKSRGKDSRYKFLNYGYRDQKILESYGKESVDRLKQASSKYDPDGFFQKAVPGGFKLSKIGAVENLLSKLPTVDQLVPKPKRMQSGRILARL